MSSYQKKSTDKESKRQSLGRIYTTKREPLKQMMYYPKSVLIDDHFLQLDSILRESSSKKQKKGKQKVIKFIGEHSQNISQIIKSMDSLYECQHRIFMQRQRINVEQQICQILKIFYSKIDKLRMERQSYKLAYHNEKEQHANKEKALNQQISKLGQEIVQLTKQKETLLENYENEQKKKLFFERQCMMLQQRMKLNSNINNLTVAESFDLVNRSVTQDNFINDSTFNDCNQSRQQNHNRFNSNNLYSDQIEQELFIKPAFYRNSMNRQNNLITYQSQNESNLIETQPQEENKSKITQQEKQKLQILLKKHNLEPHQLGGIIQQYLKDLKEQYQKQFETQEEKRLYLLAKKIDAKVWNKKVKKDIEKIITSKSSIKLKD